MGGKEKGYNARSCERGSSVDAKCKDGSSASRKFHGVTDHNILPLLEF